MLNMGWQGMLYYTFALIVGFSFHEFAHALTAYKLGDPTTKRDGRLTLSPKAHIDPLGLIFIIIMGFGWAKPVVVNPRYFKKPKRDYFLVALAGPLANFILAILFLGFCKGIIYTDSLGLGYINVAILGIIFKIFYITASLNLVLMIFNMLPLAPLDGFTVLTQLLPSRFYREIEFVREYSLYIFIGIIALGYVTNISIFGYIVTKPAGEILSFLSSFIIG